MFFSPPFRFILPPLLLIFLFMLLCFFPFSFFHSHSFLRSFYLPFLSRSFFSADFLSPSFFFPRLLSLLSRLSFQIPSFHFPFTNLNMIVLQSFIKDGLIVKSLSFLVSFQVSLLYWESLYFLVPFKGILLYYGAPLMLSVNIVVRCMFCAMVYAWRLSFKNMGSEPIYDL